jgi:hypothetical protein
MGEEEKNGVLLKDPSPLVFYRGLRGCHWEEGVCTLFPPFLRRHLATKLARYCS